MPPQAGEDVRRCVWLPGRQRRLRRLLGFSVKKDRTAVWAVEDGVLRCGLGLHHGLWLDQPCRRTGQHFLKWWFFPAGVDRVCVERPFGALAAPCFGKSGDVLGNIVAPSCRVAMLCL